MRLPNDTKIKACNFFNVIHNHSTNCIKCADYLWQGDGDLCDTGKDIIFDHLFCADTETIKEAQ